MEIGSNAGLQKSPAGIAGSDEITGGGFPRGRASVIDGGPGTGKTTTPFLKIRSFSPVRRIVGGLSRAEVLLSALGIAQS